MADVVRRFGFLLFLERFQAEVRLFLLRETCEMYRHIVLLHQNNATSFQDLSIGVQIFCDKNHLEIKGTRS